MQGQHTIRSRFLRPLCNVLVRHTTEQARRRSIQPQARAGFSSNAAMVHDGQWSWPPAHLELGHQ